MILSENEVYPFERTLPREFSPSFVLQIVIGNLRMDQTRQQTAVLTFNPLDSPAPRRYFC